MTRAAAPLSRSLARRFAAIAALIFALNALGVGIYYGTDRRVLVEEAANGEAERMEDALAGDVLPPDAPVRALYADHSNAYGFALVGRGGQVLDAINTDLIPSGALQLYADDSITQVDRHNDLLSVAGREFAEREDGLRMVFVMADDPTRLVWRAYFDQLYEHVWLLIFPLAILMIGAGAVLIRRSLRPLAEASTWPRDLRPRLSTALAADRTASS
ncbi:MAG: hypothetical protein AAF416_20520 [Pseudomonadota bacterium]